MIPGRIRARERLRALLDAFRQWSAGASQSGDGWEAGFPEWGELLARAKEFILYPLDNESLALLGECWALSEEDEDLADHAKAHIGQVEPNVVLLSRDPNPRTRWQAYDVLGSGGARSQHALRAGLRDDNTYARRRSLLALARHAPADALRLSAAFLGDSDPYLRQAAIDLLLGARDTEAVKEALRKLLHDPADHVRRRAEQALAGLEHPSQGHQP